MNVKETAAKYADYQIEMRRWFHRHPELSENEKGTSDKIKEELDKAGIPWRNCGSDGYGVLAEIKGTKPGKTMMIRGDMDALSVHEETGLPFASENPGVMHACGHDSHISMTLTAARILNDMKDELCGTVKVAFQPAEEVAKGAKWMIEDGALDGVDGCFTMHVWGGVPSGHFTCEPGPRMAGGNMFGITVTGKSGHGTAPEECVDAVVAGSAIVQNLQTIVSRKLAPMDNAVVTVGTFQAGERWNVVAGSARLEGTWRCFRRETRDKMPELIDQIAKDTAKAYGATATTDEVVLIPPVINDEHISAIVRNAGTEILGEGAAVKGDPVLGGEDFAYFMEKVPGAVLLLGISNEKCNSTYINHHNKFTVDEDMLLKGAMIFAQTALDFNAGK